MERDLEKKLVQRDFNLEIREVEKEDRTLEFPFSSEQGVARYFGNEVLEHTEKGADLTRLNDGAPVLWNHNPDQVIGVVERAWIDEKKKRGYAQVRFSEEDFAASKFRDIKNGIIRNISFGYVIKEMEQRGDDYVASSWEAYEISAVAIPADNSIGINRAAATTQESDNILLERNNSASSDAQSTSNSVEMTTTPKENLEVRSEAVDSEKLLKAERSRITNIQKAAERHNLKDLGSQYVAEGRSVADFNQAIVDNWKQEPVAQRSGSAEIGMEEKEVRSFSFLRACNYLANPTDSRAREAASFEIEASEAAAAKLGRTSRGITIPQDVLTAQRDLQTAPGSAGGDVIREELLTGSFIDILRNESACARAGATVLSGLEGNIKIPKQSGAASATWIAEGAAAAESDQTLTQVSLVPRTVGAYTDVTRKLLLQSSIDIENFVRNDLARVIALKIDLAGLYGSGVANEPLGIKNVAGIGAEAFAGAVPTFLEVIAMESDLGTANALMGSPCYITNASMRGSLKGTKKDAGSGEFLWTGGLEGELNGYRALVSNQIAAGDVWFGNFADLLMGFWSGLDLTVDPYTNSTSGTVRIVALQDCDVAVRNAESFCLGT